jgi:hypothetical protein
MDHDCSDLLDDGLGIHSGDSVREDLLVFGGPNVFDFEVRQKGVAVLPQQEAVLLVEPQVVEGGIVPDHQFIHGVEVVEEGGEHIFVNFDDQFLKIEVEHVHYRLLTVTLVDHPQHVHYQNVVASRALLRMRTSEDQAHHFLLDLGLRKGGLKTDKLRLRRITVHC